MNPGSKDSPISPGSAQLSWTQKEDFGIWEQENILLYKKCKFHITHVSMFFLLCIGKLCYKEDNFEECTLWYMDECNSLKNIQTQQIVVLFYGYKPFSILVTLSGTEILNIIEMSYNGQCWNFLKHFYS